MQNSSWGRNFRALFAKAVFSSLLLLVLKSPVHAESQGTVLSIDKTGSVYVSLGEREGVREGDLIAIEDNGRRVAILAVQEVFKNVSKLEPAGRRELERLEVGMTAVIEVTARLAAVEAAVLSFNPEAGTGFINLGFAEGMEPGARLEILDGDRVQAAAVVEETFRKVSRFKLDGKTRLRQDLTGSRARLKQEEAARTQSLLFALDRFQRQLRSKVKTESRTTFSHYDIEGNASQSFYQQGNNYRQELDVLFSDQTAGGAFVTGRLEGRWTDDLYIDPARYSLENTFIEYQSPRDRFRAGDVLGRFTDYTLVTALKGATAEHQGKNGAGDWQWQGVFGSTKSRWEDFWSEINGETLTRFVTGTRFVQNLGKKASAGVTFVRTHDDQDSTAPTSTAPSENKLVSTDWQWNPGPFFSMRSELAGSSTQFDSRRPDEAEKTDGAARLETEIFCGPFRLDNDYERVGTNFRGLSGTASTDREEFNHAVTYVRKELFRSGAGYRYFHDNLKKASARTTFNDVYEADAALYPAKAWLPDLLAEADAYLRKRTSSDTTIDDKTGNYLVQLSNRTGMWTYGISHTVVQKRDDRTLANSRDKRILDLFLRWIYQWKALRLSPSLGYSWERDKQRTTKLTDFYEIFRAGSTFSMGRYFSGRLFWVLADTDLGAAGRDQTHHNVNLGLRWNLFRDFDRSLEVTLRMNDFKREDDNTSFMENVFYVTYSHAF